LQRDIIHSITTVVVKHNNPAPLELSFYFSRVAQSSQFSAIDRRSGLFSEENFTWKRKEKNRFRHILSNTGDGNPMVLAASLIVIIVGTIKFERP